MLLVGLLVMVGVVVMVIFVVGIVWWVLDMFWLEGLLFGVVVFLIDVLVVFV